MAILPGHFGDGIGSGLAGTPSGAKNQMSHEHVTTQSTRKREFDHRSKLPSHTFRGTSDLWQAEKSDNKAKNAKSFIMLSVSGHSAFRAVFALKSFRMLCVSKCVHF